MSVDHGVIRCTVPVRASLPAGGVADQDDDEQDEDQKDEQEGSDQACGDSFSSRSMK